MATATATSPNTSTNTTIHEDDILTMHDIANEILSMKDRIDRGDGDPLELATDLYILEKAIKKAKEGLEVHVFAALGSKTTVEAHGFKISKKKASKLLQYDEIPYVEQAASYLSTAKQLAKEFYEEQEAAQKEGREPAPISHPDFGEIKRGASIKVGKETYAIRPSK